ncbi:WXG100 family type VII secretion target [Catenuloplanes sp. NPDC051500]|uniref:WXG100 family type VII secretion target n=1 Tax=Catenuloplanes sp. NPDC051500 TaxID=3363959 RepID=UPI00379EC5E4
MSDDSLVAPVHSTREAWTGASLADGFEDLVDAVRSEGWVDDLLAGAAFGLDVVSSAMDPFSALLANGLGWAMEYFEPLREMLDALTGMPDVVASHAATWTNMATALDQMGRNLQSHLAGDVPDWKGDAAAAYQGMMSYNVQGFAEVGSIALAMSIATEGAGNLVQFTRDIVRDLIADLVARVIVWAVEAIFVVTLPVIAMQIAAAVVKWAGRILTYTTALHTSISNLAKLMG